MPQVKCLSCKNMFYAKPSWIKNGYGKYCSVKCRSNSQRNGKRFRCHTCSKEVYRSLKSQKTSKSGKYFCSKSCQTHWRNSEVNTGINHPNWTTGQSSYRERLKKSEREQTCSRCETDDTRVLSVHHKDRNRDNNDLNNLIFLCHNCHFLVHKYTSESKSFITK
jgi:hypothetical protein